MRCLLFLLFLPAYFFANSLSWMDKQIATDFSPYQNSSSLTLENLEHLYEEKSEEWLLVKFTIKQGKISHEVKFSRLLFRVDAYVRAFTRLLAHFSLPDMVFLISVEDGLDLPDPHFLSVPVFAMSKSKRDVNCVLIPDFCAVGEEYQVLSGKDLLRFSPPWDKKKAQLIWRGSPAQHFFTFTDSSWENFSRLRLCQYSLTYPKLINAKFTFYLQEADKVPEMQVFKGDWLSFEHQMHYKYHLFIDGNASPYSNSVWKLLSNSLIFKPDSEWIQWYSQEWLPHVHFIPVKEALEDLIEKIIWAQNHDEEAKRLAKNARFFALNHATIHHNLFYLRKALLKYKKITAIAPRKLSR